MRRTPDSAQCFYTGTQARCRTPATQDLASIIRPRAYATPASVNRRGCGMSETIGRLLAAGNVAEVFEWGSRVVKLYRSSTRKPTAFREAAIHGAVEAMALRFRRFGACSKSAGAGVS